jgi:tol-pal system protein YbgF
MTPPFGTSIALCCDWVRGRGVFLVSATLLVASGCAMKGDVRRLQDEVTRQSSQQDAQLRELTAAIRAVQDTLDVQSDMVVDTRGGIARELRDIQTQLSQLGALTGQIQRSLASLSERVQADGARVTTSERRADPDSLRALLGRRDGGPAVAEETYEAAVTQFNRGSLNTARMAFGSFLGDFSDHRLAPSAQFYLADILEQENQLDQAIEGFLRVSELYPTSDRVPVALYRIGAIYALQGNVDEAEIYLERVVNTHPDSGAADLAQESLREIR